jgi:hypothetical protein
MAREEKGVSSYDDAPLISQASTDEQDTSLSARRARLRSLANVKSQLSEDSYSPDKEDSTQASAMAANNSSQDSESDTLIASANALVMPNQALEILNNIDQAMGACAVNLATLQSIASDQTEALKTLANTLQNQTFSELGLNLSNLTESLSAALEPMKAVGELIPSLDELVSVIGTKETDKQPAKLSEDEVLLSLADQLATGLLDPWTFKCACRAIYPHEQISDLLHRLVDLLSGQRLSADVFREAYDAIQEAGPEILKSPLLRKTTEQKDTGEQNNQLASFEVSKTDEQTAEKNDAETIPSQSELSLDQLEAVNRRYEELNEAFLRHERALQERETELVQRQQELAEKDSENQLLKAQMEELQERMEELARELQKPPVQNKVEAAPPADDPLVPASKPSPSFFDMESSHEARSLFETPKPNMPLFQNEKGSSEDETLSLDKRQSDNSMQSPSASMANQSMQETAPSLNKAKPPASANAPYVSGAGSYGSGVRAQVFEVIVRQALAGAEWKEICAGPMQVNNISAEEVESEVRRRQALLKK